MEKISRGARREGQRERVQLAWLMRKTFHYKNGGERWTCQGEPELKMQIALVIVCKHQMNSGQSLQVLYLPTISVFCFALSYSAPATSTSTNGQTIPRPFLGRCLAPRTYTWQVEEAKCLHYFGQDTKVWLQICVHGPNSKLTIQFSVKEHPRYWEISQRELEKPIPGNGCHSIAAYPAHIAST